MKKPIMICAVVALIAAFGSTAQAITENPANWTFELETFGTSASWTSDSNVPKDYPQYDYDWELTEAKLYVDLLPEQDIIDLITVDKSGSGTEFGLPFNIFGVADPLHIELVGIITADIYLVVDIEGWGRAHIPDSTLVLGEWGGSDVTGAKFGGTLNVTAVPEPATILLLGLGSLVLLRRRRKIR
ncbi:MAG: PEP-CTERM sorting domain-containing protein [Planctomycetota bacterium]|jgi:hypothetical protein